MTRRGRVGRRMLRLMISCAIFALVTWGIYATVADARNALSGKPVPWDPDPAWLAFAGLFYFCGMLPMIAFWHRALHAMGCQPRYFETLRAYCIGSLGKYVPGKALVVVLRTRMLMSERVGGTATTVSVFLETLTMMAVGAFLALLMFLLWLDVHLKEYPFLLPLSIGLLIVAGLPTWPSIFKKIVLRLGTSRFDADIESRLSGIQWGLMGHGWVLMILGWFFFAGSLWSVVRGMGLESTIDAAAVPYCLSAITLAIVAGFLSLIPGGAGVREYLITIIIGHFYFSEVLDLPFSAATALVVAVLLRLVWLAVEFALALILFAIGYFYPPIQSTS
ncbi:MAG: lysylphosphatidylglycerol synthase domain-containing protein [Planctomycetota bacterium]|nr:lysylphosphatidylglycerol synthase domain-containing protein [Planctomycetota bacterium]